MTKYQIRFCDKEGHGSFKYFETECVSVQNIEEKAALVATDYIQNRMTRGFDSWEAPRKLDVWEMDMQTKQPKINGHRFKIKLSYSVVTYGSGRKVRNEWYEPIEK